MFQWSFTTIWCISHLSMLSSWRTVILQLDLALPLLSLCLRCFQFRPLQLPVRWFQNQSKFIQWLLWSNYLKCLYCWTRSSCASSSTLGLNILANWMYRETWKHNSSSHSDPGKALTNLVLRVKSFHTLLELCVKIDDSTCDGIVGDLVAIVHQDEEQVKPGHQLLVTPVSEPTNTKN